MNDIFYHITSASLSWNPFIHFLHTIHIIPPPDIVTGWHILCLIYFSCTIQVLIKQEQRSPHSWCHYTNFQKGAAPLSSPLQSDHRALSLARGPVTLPPLRNLCGLLDTSRGHSKPLGWRPSPPPTHIPLTTWQIQPLLLPVPTQSWQMEHYYILYFKILVRRFSKMNNPQRTILWALSEPLLVNSWVSVEIPSVSTRPLFYCHRVVLRGCATVQVKHAAVFVNIILHAANQWSTSSQTKRVIRAIQHSILYHAVKASCAGMELPLILFLLAMLFISFHTATQFPFPFSLSTLQ